MQVLLTTLFRTLMDLFNFLLVVALFVFIYTVRGRYLAVLLLPGLPSHERN